MPEQGREGGLSEEVLGGPGAVATSLLTAPGEGVGAAEAAEDPYRKRLLVWAAEN